tara:strand:- start:200 stop:805 length:606 start_codon:yes stop_codon:yes gene_type:complete
MEKIKKFLLSNEEYIGKEILIIIFRDEYLIQKNISKRSNELFIDQILKILKNKNLSMSDFKKIKFDEEFQAQQKFDYIFIVIDSKKISIQNINKIINKFKIFFKTGSKLFISKFNKENIINHKLKIFYKNNKSKNLFLSKEFLLYDYLYYDYLKTFTISKNNFINIIFKFLILIIKSLFSIERLKFLADKNIIKYIFLPNK